MARPARLGSVRLVAVDGPGGAGKSTFARRLGLALAGAENGGVEIVATDDFAGWDDTTEWWGDLEERVLQPLARGHRVRYPQYDWGRPRRLRSWRSLAPPTVLILEGVSSARPEARDRLTLGIYVDAPPSVRLSRGLDRDGPGAHADWARWMAEEDEHFATAKTSRWAEVVIDGDPALEHDPEHEFVLLREGRLPG